MKIDKVKKHTLYYVEERLLNDVVNYYMLTTSDKLNVISVSEHKIEKERWNQDMWESNYRQIYEVNTKKYEYAYDYIKEFFSWILK